MDVLFEAAETPTSRVLVVDDSPVITVTLAEALKSSFLVTTASSGEECLEWLAKQDEPPSLILLDIEMDGMDGYDTCRKIRETHDLPVIFVSSHDDISERIKAFDSGGDDFITKPFDPEVVLRKAQRIVQFHTEKKALAAERNSLQSMAMDFLRNIGDTGVLLAFMRSSLGASDYVTLAQRLLDATAMYDITCQVQLRDQAGQAHTVTPHGPASPLEESIFEKSKDMGRIFQFSRRLVVNYEHVSILITDLPDDDERAGRLRDNIAILAESAEAIAETIAVRIESGQRAEALQVGMIETTTAVEELRTLYRTQQTDTRVQLETMISNIEHAFVTLGLTNSQEYQVSNILREGVDNTLQLFDVGVEMDRRFAFILEALKPKSTANSQTDVWL